MKTTYELMDLEGGNLIGTYPTENAALHVVRNGVKKHGAAEFDGVALGCENDLGGVATIAHGDELVRRAFYGTELAWFRRTILFLQEKRMFVFLESWISTVRPLHLRRTIHR
jgi:hypothetical protein